MSSWKKNFVESIMCLVFVLFFFGIQEILFYSTLDIELYHDVNDKHWELL